VEFKIFLEISVSKVTLQFDQLEGRQMQKVTKIYLLIDIDYNIIPSSRHFVREETKVVLLESG
jgi:hypothetical protein